MEIKVDTKEKFRVLRPQNHVLSVIMAEALVKAVISGFQAASKSAVIDLTLVHKTDKQALTELATLGQLCQKNGASLVFFGVAQPVRAVMEELELTDVLQLTPTESEAWDIVQMEEIERELFGDDLEDLEASGHEL